MTTTASALRWTKTRSGRYAATAGGFRYIAQRIDGEWVLSITRTVMVVDVEIADPAARSDYANPETYREAKIIAQAHADLDGVELGIRSRFSVAHSMAYDAIIAAL